ncbi:MAG: hypothetical protein E7167_06345 [Firmicutes bacterium]|nr:hypothetical protein [Bacillota bacterium]
MIGLVFGCFCPLHQGHLDIIMRAKKENDYCVVICAGYDNDRGKDFLPLNKRYRYVKEYFANDEQVKVIKINDTELGLEKEWSIGNWKPWLEEVHRKLNELGLSTYEARWYLSEPNYEQELTTQYNQKVVLCERKNPISGTMIRNNPLKYWDKIALPFRRVFSHNILIIGTSSEGKTTLVQDISKYFNCVYSYEKGRDSVTYKTDSELDGEDFIYNLYEQNKLNKRLINSKGNHGIFISDTDNLVTLMYAKAYSEREDFALTKKDYEEVLLPLSKMYAKKLRWNKIYVLAPHEKFVDDGVRCMLHSSYEDRLRFHNILLELLKEFNLEYEILNGNYYENFLSVKGYIEKLY